MLSSGADIAVVSKLAGHSSVSITADIYAHMIGTVAADAANKAAALIARTTPTHKIAGLGKSSDSCGQSLLDRESFGETVGLARFELATP
jgi:hypothetical protein